MVLKTENTPATEEESAALRTLLETGTELTRDSLLKLLRRCDGNVDAAIAQMVTLNAETASGDQMTPYGSAEYDIEVEGASALEAEDGNTVYGGRWDREPSGPAGDRSGGDDNSDAEAATPPHPAGADAAAMLNAAVADDDGYSDEVSYKNFDREHLHYDDGASVASMYRRMTVMCGGVITDALTGLTGFLNEGIQYIDVPIVATDESTIAGGDLETMVVTMDVGVLDEEAFQALLDDWLMDGVTCEDDPVLDGMGDAIDSWDFNAGGDDAATASSTRRVLGAAGLRSDPREFRAYLDALLNESPEDRARRIDQERMDEFLAQEMYLEELREYEKEEQQRARTEGGSAARGAFPPPMPPMTSRATLADGWSAAEMRFRDRAAGGPPRVLRMGPANVPHTAPQRTNRSVAVSVATAATGKTGRYQARQLNIVLPKSCRVVAIQNITNPMLERRFALAARQLRELGYSSSVDIAYHGTDPTTMLKIAEGGFIAPLSDAGAHLLVHRSGNAGFYGNGIYLSPRPATAQGYASGGRLLVCNVLRGNAYRCPGLRMGGDLQSGYSSHESPDGTEWIFFNAAQVLPVAVIHFGAQNVTYPRVLRPLQFSHYGIYADDAQFGLAAYRGNTASHNVGRPAYYASARSNAVNAKLRAKEGTHLSNKDRKALNRARKGQQQR